MSDGYYQQVDEDRFGFDIYEERQALKEKQNSEDLYSKSKRAKVGDEAICPSCKRRFKKKSYQQAFCSNNGSGNCKDRYWNRASDERASRAINYSRR